MNNHATLSARQPRHRAVILLATLALLNILAWGLAALAFSHSATLMGSAILAYSFGLRHAVDADHISAIDNITRKLMQQGKPACSVGAWFSLGHSTIVVLASLMIAGATITFRAQLVELHALGGTIGTAVSALFLTIVALINLTILMAIWRKFRLLKQGNSLPDEALDALSGGWLSRLCRPLFRLITHSWQMYLVGFLFGLGFDTATEIGLLGLSAAGAGQGMNVGTIMIFPALFAAGMVLIDTLDNLIMVGAYGWAFSRPVRKLYYNMTITGASVIVALFIGGIEALGLITETLHLNGKPWHTIVRLNDNLGDMGFWIIGLFALCWLVSFINYRLCGYDKLSVNQT
ncbi:HoxN/HupN/NixA family nickel/cobalt transporter [Apirhabdus apintestini]|nr:HoxN/HupN/NixA family nickel/cobalt transporter [Enterobacteriaceae bacterium CA-0114]